MTARTYLSLIILGSLVGWIAFTLVLISFDPCTAPGIITLCHSLATQSHILFFLSLTVALVSTFTLLGFLLRFWLHRSELYLDHVRVSFRQGILLSACVLAALVLLTLEVLTWWTGFLLIAIIILIELYYTQDL